MRKTVSQLFYLLAFVVALTAVASAIWDGIGWLRTGVWPTWPIERAWAAIGWTYPDTGWGGVQQIIRFCFDQPLCYGLAVLAFFIFAFGMRIGPRPKEPSLVQPEA